MHPPKVDGNFCHNGFKFSKISVECPIRPYTKKSLDLCIKSWISSFSFSKYFDPNSMKGKESASLDAFYEIVLPNQLPKLDNW